MMTKEGSNKIINIMTPWAGVLVLGRGHIQYVSHIVKMHLTWSDLFDGSLSFSLSLFLSVLFSVYVFEKKAQKNK